MIRKINHLFSTYVYKLLNFISIPQLKPFFLRLLWAKIWKNVRIRDVKFSNLDYSFSHLIIEDNVFIWDWSIIDLTEEVIIWKNTTISYNCLILTHNNPWLNNYFYNTYKSSWNVIIWEDCWIWSGTVINSSVIIKNKIIIWANSYIHRNLNEEDSFYVWSPAILKKKLSHG